ncbi:MAG TPA: cytochrome c biogenesis protein CcdA, partial [Patescibacteria group bacterium]
MDYSLAIPAFIAGLITFLAPCTLPLVPAYLGFISGVSIEDLGDPEKIKKVRGKIFLNGLFFVIGFSAIFVMFGVAAGLIGTLFGAYRIWLARLGGIFVIIFGLFMLNVVKLPFLSKEVKVRIPSIFKKGKILNSFILGTVFGFGWTPCVGPILGSVLLLASSSATAFQGALML